MRQIIGIIKKAKPMLIVLLGILALGIFLNIYSLHEFEKWIFHTNAPSYVMAQSQSSSISIIVEVPGVVPPPPPPPSVGPGGGGGGITLPTPGPTEIMFRGFSYPGSIVTFLRNGDVIGTALAAADGSFVRTLRITSGISTFSLWAADNEGNNSPTISFSLNVLSNTRIIASDLIIPPTIQINPKEALQGEIFTIHGSAVPNGLVHVFVDIPNIPLLSVAPDSQGLWQTILNSSNISLGSYMVEARSVLPDGLISGFSQQLSFFVLAPLALFPPPPGVMLCAGANLNFDDDINMADISILLFYWNQFYPRNNCADINKDGVVDLGDFSLVMFGWTNS